MLADTHNILYKQLVMMVYRLLITPVFEVDYISKEAIELDISPRGIELTIFELLSSGCATYPDIKAALTEAFASHQQTSMISRLSDDSLYKTLSLLRKRNLIQSCRYFDRARSRNFVLYANTENSIEVLVRESGYRRDHIRSPYLPGRYSYWHDMDLTKVVRTIKRDCPPYSYFFGLKDEYALRRSAEKAKKGDLYPDLELHLRARSGDEYFFRIEVQRHRQRVDEFARKLSKHRNNLVLCKDQALIHDIADSHVYVDNNAIFAVIDDFAENGLFKTRWLSTNGQIVGLRYSG
ncbi:MAG: hypothetical protein M0024_09405 [Nitrospiraceae bacterium]|nr:hypothetical protein [Nitrospiraceae bacterium]